MLRISNKLHNYKYIPPNTLFAKKTQVPHYEHKKLQNFAKSNPSEKLTSFFLHYIHYIVHILNNNNNEHTKK